MIEEMKKKFGDQNYESLKGTNVSKMSVEKLEETIEKQKEKEIFF